LSGLNSLALENEEEKSPREYIEGNLFIKNKHSRIVPLKLNVPQQKIYDVVEKQRMAGKPVRIILLKARQQGASTITESLIFEDSYNNANRNSLIIAHDLDSTNKLFGISKLFYDMLPGQKKSLDHSNRKELIFSAPHRSSLLVETAGNLKAGRASTLQNVHCSEFSFWPDAKTLMLGLKQCIPDLPNTMIVIESTANGIGDHFHSEYMRAKNGDSEYVAVFIAWYELLEYSRPFDNETAKNQFDVEINKPVINFDTGKEEKSEELLLKERYNLSLEQLNWRRWVISNKCDGDSELFRQEYPSDDNEAFLVSGRPVFDSRALKKYSLNTKEPIEVGNLELNDKKVSFYPNEKGFVKIWRKPEAGLSYVIGADVAEGLEIGDYSCAQILERRTLEQVAEWHGHIDPDLFGAELNKLGQYYNNCLVGCELNNHGLTSLTALKNLLYPRIYYRKTCDQKMQKETNKIGWRTDLKTKPLMIDDLGKGIRDQLLILNGKEVLAELLTFIREADGKTRAQAGCFDDRVIALAIAIQMRNQNWMLRSVSTFDPSKHLIKQ
tara:strand:+ start:4941 stop:6599 length:1659 start_codon:yes stop_codon:yes gene_type:complete